MSTEVETASEVPPSQEGSQGNGSPSPPPATIAVAPDGEGGLKEEDTGRPSRQQQRQQQHEVGPPAAASSVPAADSSGGSEGSSAPVAEKQSSDVEDDFQYLDIEESDKKEINAAGLYRLRLPQLRDLAQLSFWVEQLHQRNLCGLVETPGGAFVIKT